MRLPDGNIEELPSGKFRVRVSAGKDPVTGRARYLRETVATKAEAKAAAARLRNQVNEGRHARTDLTLNAIVRQWFEVTTHEASTRERYEQIVRLYIEPTVGREKVGRIDVQMLETLYARLRRCRGLCGPKPDRDHTCAPLAANTVRKVHFVIRASLDNAVRWGYVGVNVAAMSRPPAFKSTEQDPPSLEEAEALLAEAARDPEWALLLWLTMTLGWRRGEVCALRWSDVDLRDATITIRRSLWGRVEKGTKTHQVRRVAIDNAAVLGLTEHLDRCKAECAAAASEFTDECFVFSPALDRRTPILPASITQRYRRLAESVGLRSTRLHALRHYSASQLVSAGVDIRTVAGRLGHGSGGATTLKVSGGAAPAPRTASSTSVPSQ